MVKVSVVIPVYNVENYLEECLDSIVNQTLTDIEIICVNDGSTDSSLDILKTYAQNDDRIKVFSRSNSGQGAARNYGIKKCLGKYVYFMDSDDILELTALKELLTMSEENDLDMVIFKLLNFDDETMEEYTSSYYEMNFLSKIVDDEVFNYKKLGDKVFHLSVSVPGKFFKKSLIEDLRFPEGVIFEDNLFFIEAIFKANRVYFYKKHLYYRRIRENSTTTSNNINFMDCILVFNMINDYMKEIKLFDNYKNPLYNRKIINTYHRFTLINNEFKEEFFNRIKKDFLLHKEEFEADEDFLNVLTSKSKCIFYSAISSNTYKEFENEVELFKANIKIKKLKRSNKKLKKQINHFKSTKAYKFWKFYEKIKNKLFKLT